MPFALIFSLDSFPFSFSSTVTFKLFVDVGFEGSYPLTVCVCVCVRVCLRVDACMLWREKKVFANGEKVERER